MHIGHGSWVAKIVASASRVRPSSTGGLAQGHDDRVSGGVVRFLDAVVCARDHGFIHDGDGGDRPLPSPAASCASAECLAHEQLVVHSDAIRPLSLLSLPAPDQRRVGGTAATQPNRPASRRRSTIPSAMTTTKRIAMLTGGGDVPGLNAVIKSVVYRATEVGDEVDRPTPRLGRADPYPAWARRGRRTPTTFGRSTASTRATIDRTGGTILHTSRTNPRKMKAAGLPPWLPEAERARFETAAGVYDLTPLVLDHLSALGIDVLVTIGGDDTLSYSQVLADAGVALMAIPKTMDNDVQGTEYCIGFSTAITRAKEAINRQRTTLGSHERIGVFRIFGRDAGFSALYTAYVTSGRCVIPEEPYDLDALATLLAEDHRNNPSHYSFVITAEGAIWKGAQMVDVGEADAFGHRHKANVGEALAEELRRRTGIETLASELTYDLRSASPTRSIPWSPPRSRTWRWTSWRAASPAAWWRSSGRQVRRRGAARPRPRPAQGGRPGDVQLRSVPAPLRREAGRSDAAGGLGLTAAAQSSRPDSPRMARARADMSSSP